MLLHSTLAPSYLQTTTSYYPTVRRRSSSIWLFATHIDWAVAKGTVLFLLALAYFEWRQCTVIFISGLARWVLSSVDEKGKEDSKWVWGTAREISAKRA